MPDPTTATRPLARARRGLAALGLALALLTPGRPNAQAPAAQEVGPKDVAALQAELADAQAAGARAQGSALDDARGDALSVQADADAAVGKLATQVAAADARLAQLGPEPAPGAPPEPPPLRDERHRLGAERARADGLQKVAKLVSAQAGQAADALAEQRRQAFNAKLFQQSASPLTPPFWTAIAASLPRDLRRLDVIASQAQAAVRHAAEPRAALTMLGAALLGLALLLPARAGLEALGRRRAIADAPATSLRRSGYALWMIAVDTAAPGLAALALRFGAAWAGLLSEGAAGLANALVIAVWWGALLTALGRTLLSVERPSWRLAAISDAAALRFRPYPWIAALVTGAGLMLERVNRVAGASLAATVAADCLLALVYSAVAAAALVALGRGRAPPEPADDSGAAARASAWSLAAMAVAGAAILSAGAVLGGYSAFAYVLARQVFWIAVLCAGAYVLLAFVDDVCRALFAREGWAGRALFAVFGLRPGAADQIAVLSSAFVRLVIALAVLSLILAPFGSGGAALAGRFAGLGRGFHVGQVLVSPAALAGGVLALVIGLVLVKGFQRWLDTTYLPTTGWDAGVANSVSTAVGYLGAISAILWALASAGLGLQRIALIASALSVGIGFGLQQVVQNFVSGLILLVERPVKVGDWISVGGVEGDVRQIRVRATMIQQFDRSTVLVPNSELVTKTLQNKTMNGALGRIGLQLSVYDPADVETARDAIFAACAGNATVLVDPEPKVFIEGLTTGGAASLVCYCYVSTARDAFPTRSALYFDVLARLRRAGVVLAGAQQALVVEPGAALSRMVERGPQREPPPA